MLAIYLALMDSPEDKSKFEQLYHKYRNMMYTVAYRVLKETAASEDAVHDAFLKVAACMQNISEVDCPKTRHLLVIIVRNICINQYNDKRRHPSSPIDEMEDFLSGPADTEETAEDHEDYQLLVQLIRSLPSNYGDLLFLRYDQGFTVNQIAKMMDMKEATVYKKIERAKKALEERLRKEGERYVVR